jgi:hypothetical protein
MVNHQNCVDPMPHQWMGFKAALVECELYMAIPKGFKMEGDEEYVLKLKKNLLGQRQAGRVWNKHLLEKLKKVGSVFPLTLPPPGTPAQII